MGKHFRVCSRKNQARGRNTEQWKGNIAIKNLSRFVKFDFQLFFEAAQECLFESSLTTGCLATDVRYPIDAPNEYLLCS